MFLFCLAKLRASPPYYATQITLSANNMWGIIHMIVELFMKHDDGKYVMMKVRRKAVQAAPYYSLDGWQQVTL